MPRCRLALAWLTFFCHWRPPIPDKKRPLAKMTKEELAKRFFPTKKLRDKLNAVAHERDDEAAKNLSQE